MMAFWTVWVVCGLYGAIIQREWYQRERIKQRTPFIDAFLNVVWGPIGLIASWVSYGD